MQNDITQTWFFQQPPDEVWDYLTKPELIEKWLMKSDFKPVVGHKFRFTHVPKPGSKYKGVVECEVLEVKPYTNLSYSWNGGTADDSRTFDSIVHWTLHPKNNGTELEIKHNGFIVLEDFTAHSSGWTSCLKRIEEALNNNVHASTKI